MIPEWFAPNEIPYDKMFGDDFYALPLFLERSGKFTGRADYDKAGEGQDVGNLLRWWFGTYE